MSDLGLLRGIAGATRGLNRGLEEREEDERRAREEARRDRQEQRSEESHRQSMEQGVAQEKRAQATHDEQMRGAPGRARVQELQLERAERDKRKADFDERWDAAAGAFAASGGANYKELEKLYNEHFPDGNDVAITRDDKSGLMSMDFGNGRVLQNLSPEAVYGMAMQMKEPENYYKTIEAEKQRKQKREDILFELDARQAREKPTYETDADGGMFQIRGSTATPVTTAAGDQLKSIPGGSRGRAAAVPAMLQEIDAFAARLPKQPNETDDQRWLRAAQERSKLSGKNDPETAVRNYDAALRGKLLSNPDLVSDPEQAKKIGAFIKAEVGNFAQKYAKPQAPAGGDDSEDPLEYFKVTPPGAVR